jgi:trk system potassium uptake protein TrkH
MEKIFANLGFILQLTGLLMIIPIIVGFYYNETLPLIYLFLTSFIFLSFGFILNALSERKELNIKEACCLLFLTFLFLSLIGSIPYFLVFKSDNILESFINSFFESSSGFTTTGFSTIEFPENLPKSILIYRSLTQFIGGIGIVYLLLTFFYKEKVLKKFADVFRVEKTLNRIKTSMLEIISVYTIIAISFIFILHFLYKIDLINSSCAIFSAISTGGFLPNSKFLENKEILKILMIVMILGSTNFYILHSIFTGNFSALKSSELIMFLLIFFGSVIFVYFAFNKDLLDYSFHILSAISTTGFQYIRIEEFLKPLFIFLMFIGGMSFSTAGGIKIKRIVDLLKSIKDVVRIKVGKANEVDKNVIISLFTISFSFFLVFLFAYFVFPNLNFLDALFITVSSYSNVGLISTEIEFTIFQKIALSLLMIIGRIEIITFLVTIYNVRK